MKIFKNKNQFHCTKKDLIKLLEKLSDNAHVMLHDSDHYYDLLDFEFTTTGISLKQGKCVECSKNMRKK